MNTTHNNEHNFVWTAEHVSLSILMGLAAIAGIWVAAGLLVTFFL